MKRSEDGLFPKRTGKSPAEARRIAKAGFWMRATDIGATGHSRIKTAAQAHS
jgi:hypothetical protein